MRSAIIGSFLACMLSAVVPGGLWAKGLVKWPVKNGDFSAYQAWGRPAAWSPATETGKHTFTTDPAPTGAKNPPSAAMIRTLEAGRAYYFQTVPLMRGDYRLTVEVAGTEGAKAKVSSAGGGATATSGAIDVGRRWRPVRQLPHF